MVPREITLGSRPLPRSKFQTPAPGEYDIDKIDKSKILSGGCVRGYTFGHPNVSHRTSRTPGKLCFYGKVLTHKSIDLKAFFQSKKKLLFLSQYNFSKIKEICRIRNMERQILAGMKMNCNKSLNWLNGIFM